MTPSLPPPSQGGGACCSLPCEGEGRGGVGCQARSLKRHCSAVMAVRAAVSVRSTLGPSSISLKSSCTVRAISSLDKPPSGPISRRTPCSGTGRVLML
uniref:Uncharacterized protein n=2 Tax=Enterobacteriaceae TaxID=543 RepID=C1JZG8_ECOLX|nr:hypothetical protein [Klebsiella aerogenes]ACO24931.1 hypothetical protein [Escherichia coli]